MSWGPVTKGKIHLLLDLRGGGFVFRVTQGGRKRCLFSRTYLHFVVLISWDYLTQGVSRKIRLRSSSFYAWYLLYDYEPVL